MTKIIFVGALPPPIGGVSIYCSRKLKHLRSGAKDVLFINTKNKLSIFQLIYLVPYFKLTNKAFEIELNVSNPLVIIMFIIFGFTKYTVFVDHNGSRRLIGGNIKNFIFSIFVKNLKKVVLVSEQLSSRYKRLNVFDSERVKVQSPFYPPLEEELTDAINSYDDSIRTLIQGDLRNIVMVSASKNTHSKKTPDLYCILDSLEIFSRLVQVYPQNNFVFILGEVIKNDLHSLILEKVQSLSKYPNFYFIEGGINQIGLLKNTKLLIRLTKTDGDSVSVREALYLGAKVIASDVCTRPKGVILVSLQDIENTVGVVESVIER